MSTHQKYEQSLRISSNNQTKMQTLANRGS